MGKALSSDLILAIDEANLMVRGGQRIVYIHPEDASKVLKILREDRWPWRRRSKRWYGRLLSPRHYDENAREFRQYSRLAKNVDQPIRCISKIFGYAKTTRGRALVAEHVRNADGKTSKSLKSYLEGNGVERILPRVDDLFETLGTNHVVVSDFSMKNILVREKNNDALDLVIIDGFGDSSLIPFASFSKRLNRRKLMRKKRRLMRRLQARMAATEAQT